MIAKYLKYLWFFPVFGMLAVVTSCGNTSDEYIVNHNTTPQALPFVSQVLWTSVDARMPNRKKFIRILREQFRAFGIGLLMNTQTNDKKSHKNKILFLDIKLKKYKNIHMDNTEHGNILIWTLKSTQNKAKTSTYEMFIPTTEQQWQNGNTQIIRLSVVLGFKSFEKQLNKSFDLIDLNKSQNKLYLEVNSNISSDNQRIFTQAIQDNLQKKHVNLVSKDSPYDLKLSIHMTRIKITDDIDIYYPKSRLKIAWELTKGENKELLYAFSQENVIVDDYFTHDKWEKLVELIAKIGAKTIYLHILTVDNSKNNESYINGNSSHNLKHVKRKQLIIPVLKD